MRIELTMLQLATIREVTGKILPSQAAEMRVSPEDLHDAYLAINDAAAEVPFYDQVKQSTEGDTHES